MMMEIFEIWCMRKYQQSRRAKWKIKNSNYHDKKKNNFCVNGWIMMFCWHSMKRRTVYDFNYIRYENVYLIIIFSHWKFIIHHFLSHPLEKSTSVWIIKMLRNRYLLHISAFPMSITKHWKMRKKYDEINETKYRFY